MILPPRSTWAALAAAVGVLSAAATPPATRPEFAVASVKLSGPDAPTRGTDLLSPFQVAPPKGGRVSANATLFNYIGFAYKIVDTSQYRHLVESLPDWAQTQQFDIEARADGTPTTDEIRLMMQSLLESRFKLAIHRETRQRPVFELVLNEPGRPGPHLRPHPGNVACAESAEVPQAVSPGKAPSLHCGLNGWVADGRLHQTMIDVPIEDIVTYLEGAAGFLGGREHLPVLDRTGLKGNFDMEIEFAKDSLGSEVDSDASGPTFTKALERQLGMKLAKTTGPVSVIVIDHVEKPSAN